MYHIKEGKKGTKHDESPDVGKGNYGLQLTCFLKETRSRDVLQQANLSMIPLPHVKGDGFETLLGGL